MKPIALSYQDDLAKVIEEIIRKLHAGELKAGDVDPTLWELIAKELFGAVEEGFGVAMSSAQAAERNMLTALRSNVYVFSGFKNYNMLREASMLLVDEHGKVRPFAKFRDAILKLNDQYNVDFLRAEYNHAIGTSRMASKWMQFEKDQAVLPLLQYITAGDARVRASHRPLNNIILPVDHPFWDTWMPPNDWNCRCNVRQLAEGEQSIVKESELPEIKDEFKFNPGKQRVIFPRSHPYYQVQAEDQANADNNFGLSIPE